MKMNPRQMEKMMRQMGVQQEDLDVLEVVIRLEDRELVFAKPQVAKVNMMGQVSYQVVGEPEERLLDSTPDINDEDVKTVMEQAECSEQEARDALDETKGDLAEAILKLAE